MKTIILFLDAFRYEDLTKENAPYLYALAKGGTSGRLKTLAGYHVEYSMLSGYYPLKHNVWIWYYHDPKNSCFRWIRPFKPILSALDRTFLRNLSRNAISYATMLFRYINGKTRLLKANEIPISKLDRFNISVDKFYTDKNSLNIPTLFDVLRKNKKFFALEYPWKTTNKNMGLTFFAKRDQSNFDMLKAKIYQNYDVLYCHIWNLDSLQHKYGIKSMEVLDHIKLIDRNVKDLVESAKKMDSHVNVIIFSDHGMTPVKETINALNVIKDYDAEYFLGSTMTQIWLKNKENKEEIKQRFLKLNCLVYDENNIKELKIPYRREFVGDVLVAAKPGCQFYPDFFRRSKNATAMHGYATKNSDLDGIFIVNGKNIKRKELKAASLVDITPTILKLVGIKTKERYDGKARI